MIRFLVALLLIAVSLPAAGADESVWRAEVTEQEDGSRTFEKLTTIHRKVLENRRVWSCEYSDTETTMTVPKDYVISVSNDFAWIYAKPAENQDCIIGGRECLAQRFALKGKCSDENPLSEAER